MRQIFSILFLGITLKASLALVCPRDFSTLSAVIRDWGFWNPSKIHTAVTSSSKTNHAAS